MRYIIGVGAELDRSGERLDPAVVEAAVNVIVKEASDQFGGVFLVPGLGGWIDTGGLGLVKENGIAIVIETDDGEYQRSSAIAFAARVRDLLVQKSVLFTAIASETTLI